MSPPGKSLEIRKVLFPKMGDLGRQGRRGFSEERRGRQTIWETHIGC